MHKCCMYPQYFIQHTKQRDVVWCYMTQNIASVCFRWWSKLPMKFHGIPTSNIVGWHILIVFAFDLYFECEPSYGGIAPLTTMLFTEPVSKRMDNVRLAGPRRLKLALVSNFEALGYNTHKHSVTSPGTEVTCILNILYIFKREIWCGAIWHRR